MITLTLTPEYAQAVLQVLGNLPTQTNAYPIYKEIQRQYELQTENDESPVEDEKKGPSNKVAGNSKLSKSES